MRKYNVHLYPVVRVEVSVNAESPEEAAKQAEADFLSDPFSFVKDGEYAEELDQNTIVDEINFDSNRDPVIGESFEINLDENPAPDYRQIVERMLNMSDPEHPDFVDSGADVIAHLWEQTKSLRTGT